MAKQLLTGFGKRGKTNFNPSEKVFARLNVPTPDLDEIQVDIEDKSHLSKYFQVVEFSPSFTAGKNSFSFNGTDFLKDGTEIKMQVLDSERNSLYIDSPPMEIHYIDLANFTTAIHINKETVGGPGKIILVGTTVKDEIVRWIGNIYIDIASTNLSRVRFYKEPTLEINSLIYPVVSGSTDYGSSQEGTSHLVTITGNFVGRDYLMGKSVTRGGTYYTIQTDDFTLDPLLYPTASFNSQMVGQNIELYITHISTKSQVAGTFGEKIEVNSTQSFKVSQIQQYNKLKLDRNVISPLNGEVVRECLGRFKATYVFIDDNIRSNYQAKASGSVLAQGYCGTGAVTPPLGSVIPNNFDYNTLDYRVYIAPQWAKLFDSSMNGKIIELHTTYLRYEPGGEIHIPYSSTQSFTIKKVLDTGTLQTTMPFTKYQGKPGQYPIADIMWAWYEVKDTPTTPTPSITTTASLATSYAEIVYRNLTTFSGFVSRHKLFMNSLIYSPPQWEVIIDEEISNKEMLMDPLASKASQYIGGFYSQQQIKKYWIQNNSDFLNVLKYTNIPDAMIISSVNDYSLSDGNQYVIMKTAAPGVVNDSNYYPFDKECHRNLSGSSYSSNPLHLYKDTLYVLSVPYARLLNSSSDTEAKVSFYFTSSTPSIIGEPAYSKQYGLKIGELFSDINESMTVFENQLLFFTPKEDYFGTLVIVPYHSDFIVSGLSLKIYGDYAFSPDTYVCRIPFSVHMANEGVQFKAELYDNSAVTVYSGLEAMQTFDSRGETGVISSEGIPTYAIQDFTIGGNLKISNIGSGYTNRILGINTGTGIVAATNISNISLVSTNANVLTKDYINVVTEESDGQHIGRSIAVRYSGSAPHVYGRRIYVDQAGIKHTFL